MVHPFCETVLWLFVFYYNIAPDAFHIEISSLAPIVEAMTPTRRYTSWSVRQADLARFDLYSGPRSSYSREGIYHFIVGRDLCWHIYCHLYLHILQWVSFLLCIFPFSFSSSGLLRSPTGCVLCRTGRPTQATVAFISFLTTCRYISIRPWYRRLLFSGLFSPARNNFSWSRLRRKKMRY